MSIVSGANRHYIQQSLIRNFSNDRNMVMVYEVDNPKPARLSPTQVYSGKYLYPDRIEQQIAEIEQLINRPVYNNENLLQYLRLIQKPGFHPLPSELFANGVRLIQSTYARAQTMSLVKNPFFMGAIVELRQLKDKESERLIDTYWTQNMDTLSLRLEKLESALEKPEHLERHGFGLGVYAYNVPGLILSDNPVLYAKSGLLTHAGQFKKAPGLGDTLLLPVSPYQLLVMYHREPNLKALESPDFIVEALLKTSFSEFVARDDFRISSKRLHLMGKDYKKWTQDTLKIVGQAFIKKAQSKNSQSELPGFNGAPLPRIKDKFPESLISG